MRTLAPRRRRVLDAWVAYQDVALTAQPGEFLLVADDDQTYVAATRGVLAVLGYEPAEMVGGRITDFASPELRDATPSQWAAFLAAGRQDGRFRLRTKDGRSIQLNFQARAHHPIAGFHVSRLWPDLDDVSERSSLTAALPSSSRLTGDHGGCA